MESMLTRPHMFYSLYIKHVNQLVTIEHLICFINFITKCLFLVQIKAAAKLQAFVRNQDWIPLTKPNDTSKYSDDIILSTFS